VLPDHHKRTCNRMSVCILSHHSMFTYCLDPLGAPNSLIPFQLRTTPLWWFNVTSNSKTYLGLHVKSPIFFLILIKFRFFFNRFSSTSPISNFTEMHPVGAALIRTDRWTDKQLDMMKLIGVFCKYSKVPTKWTEHT